MNPEALHLDLAAIGVAIGAGALLAMFRWPSATAACTSVAAVAVAVVLVAQGQAPGLLIAGVALVGLAAGLPSRRGGTLAAGGAGAILLALQDPVPGAVLLVGIGAITLLVAARRPRPDAAALPTATLLAAALLGTAAGAPDTEGAVIGLAALVPAYLAALLVRPYRDPFDHHALLLLGAWIAVDGYRGRPAGLPSAAVAVAAVMVAALGLLATRNRSAANWGVAALAMVGCLVAGRTIGLADDRTAMAIAAGMLAAVAIGAAGALTARPGSPRTPAG